MFFYDLIVASVKGQAAEVPVEQQKAPGATYGTEIPYKVRIPWTQLPAGGRLHKQIFNKEKQWGLCSNHTNTQK